MFLLSSCHIVVSKAFLRRFASQMKVLNVAEKNDAARSLATIMSQGHSSRREGYSKFNKIYEFPYHLFGQQCQMVMTSVSGHLLNFEFSNMYKSWQKHDPVVLFSASVHKACPANYVDIKRTLEKEIRSCQKLIIWTDCDREGENIGYEIINVCRDVKNNIDVYRAVFSEITAAAVQRALHNLGRPDQLTSDAVDVRQELDLRIGAAFTRFQTLQLRQAFPRVLADQLISYGSCQFPTLGFVVERYKEIESFISEPFWKIKVTHEKKDSKAEFVWKRVRLFNEDAVTVLYEYCLEAPTAHVVKVNSKSKSKWRPFALDTVELEKLASRKLRINAKEAMRIAEKLYTQGYISYPRTETNIFPKELALRPLVEKQVRDSRWAEFASQLLEVGPQPHNGKKTDKAHPPIHPLKAGEGLGGNEGRIYELITRHFLACLSANAKGMEVEVEIDINGERFEAKGLTVLERNYLVVYIYDRWSDKEIPEYRQGEEFQPSSIEKVEGATSAPPLLTEADLITLMDKHGIGTDATHAEHIETIKNRSYVGLQDGKSFVPGELGMGLVEGYDAMGFLMSKPHLRAELERDLKHICEGTKRKEDVLATHIEKYKTVFIEAARQSTKLFESLSRFFGEVTESGVSPYPTGDNSGDEPVRICSCGSEMTIRRKKSDNGLFISCGGYPSCRRALWLPESVTEVRVLSGQLCPNHSPNERVHLLVFRFRRRSGLHPVFMQDEEYSGCPECDSNLRDHLGLHYSGGNRPSESAAPASRSAPPPRAAPVPRAAPAFDAAPGPSQALRLDPGPPPDDGVVHCDCGQPARSLTVRKEGPNQGRGFHRCAGDGCRFFQWADEPPAAATARPPNRPPARRAPDPGGAGPTEVPNCECGNPARLLTTQKPGPNQGKQFFTCSKPRGEDCRFFKWADAVSSSSSSFRGSSNSRSTSNEPSWPPRPTGPSSRPPKARGPRHCSLCGQVGHTRVKCPQA